MKSGGSSPGEREYLSVFSPADVTGHALWSYIHELTEAIMSRWLRYAILPAALYVGITLTAAQEAPQKLPTKEDLAKDNKLFITLASKALKWDEPAEPIKIAGPL